MRDNVVQVGLSTSLCFVFMYSRGTQPKALRRAWKPAQGQGKRNRRLRNKDNKKQRQQQQRQTASALVVLGGSGPHELSQLAKHHHHPFALCANEYVRKACASWRRDYTGTQFVGLFFLKGSRPAGLAAAVLSRQSEAYHLSRQ